MPPRRSDDELAAVAPELAPRVPWGEFRQLLEFGEDGFRQGDHVTILAPTGGGKTTLAFEVVNIREYVLGLFTKPRDPLIDELARHGWRITATLDIHTRDGVVTDRRIAYHPVFRRGTIQQKKKAQASAIREALDYAFEAGGWCVLADESLWLSKHLKLGDEIDAHLFQGRTSDISFVGVGQRPFSVPLAMLSQVEHLFLGHTTEARDVRRLGEIGGMVDSDVVRYIVRHLERYEFLYVQPHTGVMVIVKVDAPMLPSAAPAPKPV